MPGGEESARHVPAQNAAGRFEVTDPDDRRWISFAASHREGGPFHHPAWSRTLAEAYGYGSMILAMSGSGGGLVAGLPLMDVRSRLTGHRYVSLPFTDYCPPLAADRASLEALARHVADWRRESGGSPLEIHAALPANGAARLWTAAFLHTLRLDADSQKLFDSFQGSQVPRAIRKAERSGVEVHLGRSRDELDAYYRLHCQTRHRQGVPVQPKHFFRGLWEKELSQDLGFTALAYHGRRPIAGAVFLAWNGRLIYKYGASDRASWGLRPNNLVMWKAMEWGSANGCGVLDLGKTDPEDQGLREFKRRWGATEHPLTYATLTDGPVRPSGGLARRLAPLIRRAPPAVGRLVGEMLYRHVA
jgi:CelD/BcsL family acetyltransferase involved in cellulose biosynthesis